MVWYRYAKSGQGNSKKQIIIAGTKTDRFKNVMKITDARVKVYVPLRVQKNVKSMEFDGAGNCVAGC